MNTMNEASHDQPSYGESIPIAIIGAGCRLPKAQNIFEFWQRIADGEALGRTICSEDLAAIGLDPSCLGKSNFVPVAMEVKDPDLFDFRYFNLTKAEADALDPQHRLFMMCAAEALEMAGYRSRDAELRVGVIGSTRMSTYRSAGRSDVQNIASPKVFSTLLGNDKDYLATRTAYHMNLTGPAYTVQTACSSSLVAVHLACEAIISGEAEIMLAGGASVTFPQNAGYFHQEGMIFSPDGKCRPFDEKAEGTLMGNGVGIVALKKLDQAIEDGDPILATIRGSAINNDGHNKTGYTAPSVSGQIEVIKDALAISHVSADTIGLVEAHGTATKLGDPIEISALRQAWADDGATKGQAAIGSLKSNVGHLDIAAGIGSLLKASLALWQRQIPPSLNFDTPNPKINFEDSPFWVPTALAPWQEQAHPCRAAVSSFGIGGTNAHVILEEFVPTPSATPAEPEVLPLFLSAPNADELTALARHHSERLASREAFFDAQNYCASSLYDMAVHPHRLLVLGRDAEDWLDALGDFQDTPEGTRTENGVTFTCINGCQEGEQVNIDAYAAAARTPKPDWSGFIAPAKRRSLIPVALFDKERCWVADERQQERAPRHNAAGTAKPSANWQQLTAAAEQITAKHAQDLSFEGVATENALVAELHSFYATRALKDSALLAQADALHTPGEIMADLGFKADYADLVARLLRDLAEAGYLHKSNQDGQIVYGQLKSANIDDNSLLNQMKHAGYERLANLVSRTGPHLGEFLRGTKDARAAIFPKGSTADVEHMYEGQPFSKFLNRILADVVSTFAKQRDTPVAILEVGAGTGGTSSAILPLLPKGRCRDYLFTDLGSLFLKNAKDKFSGYDFMSYQLFDIEKPCDQQIESGRQFDVIVAANVLHNGAELKSVVSNLAARLAPGGIMVLREVTEHKKLFDFVFGPVVPVIKDTSYRRGELFAAADIWFDTFGACGLSASAAYPAEGRAGSELGEQVLVAYKPAPAAAADDGPMDLVVTVSAEKTGATSFWPASALTSAVSAELRLAEPDLNLADVTWLAAPTGAPSPLGLKVTKLPGLVVARLGETPLFTAKWGAYGPPELASYPQGLATPFDQKGELYAWEHQPVPLESSQPKDDYEMIADEEGPQFFATLKEQLAKPTTKPIIVYSTNRHSDSAAAGGPSWLPGMLRVARHEFTRPILHLVSPHSPSLAEVSALCAAGVGEAECQDGQWLTPKLKKLSDRGYDTVGADSHVFIGGLTPLGFAVAKWNLDRGVRQQVWLVRHAISDQQQRHLDRLEERGANIQVLTGVDVRQPADVSAALAKVAGICAKVDTVWYLAGTIADMPIEELSYEILQGTIATRVGGALNIQRADETLRPRQTVYFSSAATVLGPKGQAAHAAACSALETLACERNSKGMVTKAIAWGYWAATASADAQTQQRMDQGGMKPLGTEKALELLAAALNAAPPRVAAMNFDWSALPTSGLSSADLSEFEDFVQLAEHSARKGSKAAGCEEPTTVEGNLEDYLRQAIAAQLGCPPSQIKDSSNLIQLGLDSLSFLDLGEKIAADLKVKVNAERIFQTGTFKDMVAAIASQQASAKPSQGESEKKSLLRQRLEQIAATDAEFLTAHGDVRPMPSATNVKITPWQHARWFADGEPDKYLYVEYDQPLSFPIAKLSAAWRRVVERHPLLTATITGAGTIALATDPAAELEVIDLSAMAASEIAAERMALRERYCPSEQDEHASRQSLHFAVTTGKDSHRLHLAIPMHLVDIESFRIILRELNEDVSAGTQPQAATDFSPLDYSLALGRIGAGAQEQPQPEAKTPTLPWRAGKGVQFTILRDELPADLWHGIKRSGRELGATGTDTLLAAWCLVLRDALADPALALRLDYTDRLPLHRDVSRIVVDATTAAAVPFDLATARNFADLVGQARKGREDHLARSLPGSSRESELRLPVAMTSLLGVRREYDIPEVSDPLLGMPSFEYASQPFTPLHLQVLEEESALLYNIDAQASKIPPELAYHAMGALASLLDALGSMPANWQLPLDRLLPVDDGIVAFSQAAREERS